MPGIFGFVSARPLPQAGEILREMGSLLSSHGDQDAAAIVGGTWGLGATWIPGLQADPEPLAPAGGGPCSVAVGEVYPSGSALTAPPASPRGAILEALSAGDPARLANANGQFAGAVLDPRTGTLSVVCDRYGLHPLYYTWKEGLFAFASELKALLALPGLSTGLDPQGLANLLLLGEQFADTTLLGAVKAAPAAALLRSRGGRPEVTRWWRIRFTASIPETERADAAREAGRLFRQAVVRQSADPRRIGVPLSGGLDSRICLAAIPEPGGLPPRPSPGGTRAASTGGSRRRSPGDAGPAISTSTTATSASWTSPPRGSGSRMGCPAAPTSISCRISTTWPPMPT